MILSNTRITKALIRLRGCAGWSAPLLFANSEDRFCRVEAKLCSTGVQHLRSELTVNINLAPDAYPSRLRSPFFFLMTQHPIIVPQRVQLGINPFTPNWISNYHLDMSIFVLSINIFYSNFNRTFCIPSFAFLWGQGCKTQSNN